MTTHQTKHENLEIKPFDFLVVVGQYSFSETLINEVLNQKI